MSFWKIINHNSSILFKNNICINSSNCQVGKFSGGPKLMQFEKNVPICEKCLEKTRFVFIFPCLVSWKKMYFSPLSKARITFCQNVQILCILICQMIHLHNSYYIWWIILNDSAQFILMESFNEDKQFHGHLVKLLRALRGPKQERVVILLRKCMFSKLKNTSQRNISILKFCSSFIS